MGYTISKKFWQKLLKSDGIFKFLGDFSLFSINRIIRLVKNLNRFFRLETFPVS